MFYSLFEIAVEEHAMLSSGISYFLYSRWLLEVECYFVRGMFYSLLEIAVKSAKYKDKQ